MAAGAAVGCARSADSARSAACTQAAPALGYLPVHGAASNARAAVGGGAGVASWWDDGVSEAVSSGTQLEDVVERARETFVAALRGRSAVVLRRRCRVCGTARDTRVLYDAWFDPLGFGVEVSDEYVDDGADLALYRHGKPVLSLWFDAARPTAVNQARVGGTGSSTRRARVDPCALRSNWAPAVSKEAVVLPVRNATPVPDAGGGGQEYEEEQPCPGPMGRGCLDLRELAIRLGLLAEWSDDEVDWDRDDVDLTRYVANSCTGRYRVYRRWCTPDHPAPGLEPPTNPLWRELRRRAACPRCLQTFATGPSNVDATPGTSDARATDGASVPQFTRSAAAPSPLCAECSSATAAEHARWASSGRTDRDWPYDTRTIDVTSLRMRRARLHWMYAIRHIRRPTRAQQQLTAAGTSTGANGGGDARDRGETDNDLPCVRCRRTRYTAAFYYGPRSICNLCLAPVFAEKYDAPMREVNQSQANQSPHVTSLAGAPAHRVATTTKEVDAKQPPSAQFASHSPNVRGVPKTQDGAPKKQGGAQAAGAAAAAAAAATAAADAAWAANTASAIDTRYDNWAGVGRAGNWDHPWSSS